MGDVRTHYTRREVRCIHCGETIPIGTLVHVVDVDERPAAAHVRCDLERLNVSWRRTG